MIKKNIDHFSVKLMCKLLSVSTSGYYDWRDRAPSKRTQENAILAGKIKMIYDEEHARAGAKRMAKRLNLEDIKIGHHRVARIMRANGWRAKAARKFKATTNSNHKLPVALIYYNKNFQQADQMKNGFLI